MALGRDALVTLLNFLSRIIMSVSSPRRRSRDEGRWWPDKEPVSRRGKVRERGKGIFSPRASLLHLPVPTADTTIAVPSSRNTNTIDIDGRDATALSRAPLLHVTTPILPSPYPFVTLLLFACLCDPKVSQKAAMSSNSASDTISV